MINYEMKKQRRSKIISLSIMGRKLRKQKVLLYCGRKPRYIYGLGASRPTKVAINPRLQYHINAHPFLLSIAVLSTDRGKTEKINESYTGMASRLKRSNVLFAFGQTAGELPAQRIYVRARYYRGNIEFRQASNCFYL